MGLIETNGLLGSDFSKLTKTEKDGTNELIEYSPLTDDCRHLGLVDSLGSDGRTAPEWREIASN